MLCVCGVGFIASARAFRRQLREHHARDVADKKKDASSDAERATHPSALVRVLDVLLGGLLLLSACTVLVHKWNASKLPFLLQPCHLLHAFMLYLLSLPRGSDKGAVLLSVYLHLLCAPFLGTVAVDMSCYKQRFEALNWGVQHGMLLFMPFYLLATRRFGSRVHSGAAIFGTSFSVFVMLHWLVFVPVSALTGANINYTICPPPGQDLLMKFQSFYRLPMVLVCALLSWVLRYGVVEGFLRCCVDGKKHKQQQLDAKKAKVVPEDEQHESAKVVAADGLRQRRVA